MNTRSTLIEKIESLPDDRIAEIEDFVEFIGLREETRALRRAFAGIPAAFLQIAGGIGLSCEAADQPRSTVRFWSVLASIPYRSLGKRQRTRARSARRFFRGRRIRVSISKMRKPPVLSGSIWRMHQIAVPSGSIERAM